MSLFPSAQAVRNSSSESASISNTENKLDWLNNSSYKDATGSTSDQRVPVDSKPLKDGETSIKVEDGRQRSTSPYPVSRDCHKRHREKKPKRHKERRGREGDHHHPSKKRRSKSRSRSPENNISSRPSSFWLDDQEDPTKTIFFLDSKSDRNNLCFKSVNYEDAAFYRALGRTCLGGSHLNPDIFRDAKSKARSKKKHLANDRYFCHPHSAKDADETVDMSKAAGHSKEPRDENRLGFTDTKKGSVEKVDPFIAIESTKSAPSKQSELDPLNLLDKARQQYLGIISTVKEENTAEAKPGAAITDPMTERVASFNSHLNDNPQDVEKWVEFINFQEELMDSSMFNQKAGRQGQLRNREQLLVQRKLSILEKALQKNPKCLRLQLEKVEICQNHWETGKVSQLWEEMLKDHRGEMGFWRAYLLYCQSSYSSFSVSKVATLYGDCIQDLLKTEVDEGRQSEMEDNLLEIFLQLCHFWHQSGQTEKSVAAFQAMIELNVFRPTNLEDSTLSGQLAFLETFWDSDEPKFGEAGAKGWSHWMHIKEKGGWQNSAHSENADSEEEDSLDPSLSNVQVWLVEETRRGSQQFLPWRPDPSKGESADDCEDPDRLILFDDIGKTLFRLTSEQCTWQLILSFLEFLGVGNEAMLNTVSQRTHTFLSTVLQSAADITGSKFAVVGENANSSSWSNILSSWHSIWDKPCPGLLHSCDGITMEQAPVESKRKGQSDKDSAALGRFVDNAVLQLLGRVPPVKQAFLHNLQLRFHLTKVTLSTEPKIRKKQVKVVQKVAKKTLSLEGNRNNLALWETYALWEWALGSLTESQRIFETALTFAGVPQREDEIGNYTRLIHTISTLKLHLVFSASRSQPRYQDESKKLDPDIVRREVLNFLATLGEGVKFIPLPQYHESQVTSGRILKARKRFVELLEEAQMDYSPIVGPHRAPSFDSPAVPSGSYLYHLCNCYAIFQYITVSLQAAGVVYQDMLSFIDKVPAQDKVSSFSSSQAELDRELITVAQVQLLSYHCMVNPVPLTPLRNILEGALSRYPANSTLLEVFLQTESKGQVMGRLRRYFHHAVETTESPVPMFYAITSELRRQSRMSGSHETDISPAIEVGSINVETGVSHHIRSLFERAVRSRHTRHCILFWRMFIQFEISQANMKNAKAIFYRSLQHCPWSKVLYMDMIRYFPEETEEFIDLMMEKELRVRVPLEEIELIMSAASGN